MEFDAGEPDGFVPGEPSRSILGYVRPLHFDTRDLIENLLTAQTTFALNQTAENAGLVEDAQLNLLKNIRDHYDLILCGKSATRP